MRHEDFLEQVDAWALGALEPEEARALERHLRDEGPHPECEAARRRAESTVSSFADDVAPVAPPAHVWAAIERRLGPGESAPARDAASPTSARVRTVVRLRRLAPWAAGALAAAAAVLLVLGGVRLGRVQRSEEIASAAAAQCARELADARVDLLRKEDALKLLVEPGTQLVSLKGPPERTGAGVVIWNPRGRALFLAQRLPSEPTRDYELWLIRDGKPVAAGLVPSLDGQVLVDVRAEALAGGRPQAFAVSVEPKGGSIAAPQGPIVLQGALGAP